MVDAVWTWGPDWSEGVIERLQWLTDVLQAARGEEQRRALRIGLRQFVEFTPVASDIDRRLMESALYRHGAGTWAVPLWFDGMELAAPLSSGATSIPLNPSGRGFAAGDYVLITSGNPRDYELIEVDSVSSTIGLDSATAKAWPAGTRVYPAREARLDVHPMAARFTGATSSVRLIWRMERSPEWPSAAAPTYRDLPVLEHRPNWVEDPTLQFERKTSVLDPNTGIAEVIDDAEMPLTIQRMVFTLTSRTEIDTWKKRLWTLRGKQGAIWVPTWADDLQVAAAVGSADTTIDVAACGFTDLLFNEPNRRDIRIELLDGTVFYRRITGASEISASVERLTINGSLAADVAASDVALVSFMAQSRSDSDQHEFAYFTGEAADVTFTARSYRGAA